MIRWIQTLMDRVRDAWGARQNGASAPPARPAPETDPPPLLTREANVWTREPPADRPLPQRQTEAREESQALFPSLSSEPWSADTPYSPADMQAPERHGQLENPSRYAADGTRDPLENRVTNRIASPAGPQLPWQDSPSDRPAAPVPAPPAAPDTKQVADELAVLCRRYSSDIATQEVL